MVDIIKLRDEISVKKTLNNVSDVAGETINIMVGWDVLEGCFRRNHDKFLDKNKGWAIRDQKLAEDFDYFTNSSNGGRLPRDWGDYMRWMRGAGRLFPGDNMAKVGGLRAFKFLKKCIGDIPLDIKYYNGTNALISDFSDSVSNESKKSLFSYLNIRPLFSRLSREIKERGDKSKIKLLYVTDDKKEFLNSLTKHRFNILLWELENGNWSFIVAQNNDKWVYYTNTRDELQVDQEQAQVQEFVYPVHFDEEGFAIWSSEKEECKQGFAIVGIETILTKIKANPLQVLPKKDEKMSLLQKTDLDNAQKEYDIYLENLEQENQQIAQIEVGPKS